MFEILTNENYLLFAMKAYQNLGCQTLEEFQEDLSRVKYIKRLLNRYVRIGDLKERLILNHLIIFCNTFGNEAAIKMLFFKLNDVLHAPLKTFLVFLNTMPESVHGVRNHAIYNSDLLIDRGIVKILRKI